MKRIICSLLLISLLSLSGKLISQNSAKTLDQVYGLDQTLLNGKKYDYYPPYGYKGNQYLFSREYKIGSVTLKEEAYQDVLLNYDIYNQQLLLKYEDEKGARHILEVSRAWLTDFSIGDKNFEFLDLQQEPRFYQVLGEGPVRILYYWRKGLDLDIMVGSYVYVFSKAVRESFVLKEGQLKSFRSKQSLIRLFEPEHKQKIKSYLRKHKVKVKRAPDKVMAEMITFIGNIK